MATSTTDLSVQGRLARLERQVAALSPTHVETVPAVGEREALVKVLVSGAAADLIAILEPATPDPPVTLVQPLVDEPAGEARL